MENTQMKTYLISGIVLLALVFVGLLIFGGSDEVAVEETVIAESVPVLQQAIAEPIQEPVASSRTRQLDELCEDYSFKQGEVAELDGNTLEVKRIARSGVLLRVNDEDISVSYGDNEEVDDFLVELAEDDILFFGTDDADNTVLLRLGCERASEDPNDKYVREKGSAICQQLITVCADEFDYEV